MVHPDLIGIRTIIFDMDGTLIQSSELAKKALRSGLKSFYAEKGIDPPNYSDEELLAGIGMVSSEYYKALLEEKYKPEWKKYRDFIFKEEGEYLKNNNVTFRGVVKTLELLKKRGYRMGVVSNCSGEYLQKVMETQNLARHFEVYTCVDDQPGVTKAQLVKQVAEQLGGGKAVVIGDRAFDVDAAKENGFPAVGALYGYGDREELMGTSTWVEDFRDLKYIFYPLRELAEILAIKINRNRPLDRPYIVGLSGLFESITNSLGHALMYELSERNVHVSHLRLEQFRENGLPIKKLRSDILTKRFSERIDTSWEILNGEDKGKIKPIRVRNGSVLLVESPLLERKGKKAKEDFDYFIWVEATNRNVKKAIRRVREEKQNRLIISGVYRQTAIKQTSDEMQEVLELWSNSGIKAAKEFKNRCNPLENADIIVDGDHLDKGLTLKGEKDG